MTKFYIIKDFRHDTIKCCEYTKNATVLLHIDDIIISVNETRRQCQSKLHHDFQETSMLFLGGLIVAVAVEEVGLHTRIAMGIINILGSNPNM